MNNGRERSRNATSYDPCSAAFRCFLFYEFLSATWSCGVQANSRSIELGIHCKRNQSKDDRSYTIPINNSLKKPKLVLYNRTNKT